MVESCSRENEIRGVATLQLCATLESCGLNLRETRS
nr:MAG TPA: hypothetical protein [Caudoviricetes sp.]